MQFTIRPLLIATAAVAASLPCSAFGGGREIPSEEFAGAAAGEEREVLGIKLCWCPAGTFLMGSPPDEPERRPGEDQVKVTLTQGYWIAKYETTQGQWLKVTGNLPGDLTAELPEGEDFPLGNVNFAEAEAFCERLTELAVR